MKFNRKVYQALTMIGQFGINMLVPVFICFFLGMFLDEKLGTNFLVVILLAQWQAGIMYTDLPEEFMQVAVNSRHICTRAEKTGEK